FYEGLRPIRCRKIRYFADRRFRERLLPAPEVPLPPRRAAAGVPPEPPTATAQSESLSTPESAVDAPRPKNEEGVIREGTLADVATDFSRVRIPDQDGPLSDAEMQVAVESFLVSLERT